MYAAHNWEGKHECLAADVQMCVKICITEQSKHLKGRLDPPVGDKKCVKRKMITFSSCVVEVSWIPLLVTKSVCNKK